MLPHPHAHPPAPFHPHYPPGAPHSAPHFHHGYPHSPFMPPPPPYTFPRTVPTNTMCHTHTHPSTTSTAPKKSEKTRRTNTRRRRRGGGGAGAGAAPGTRASRNRKSKTELADDCAADDAVSSSASSNGAADNQSQQQHKNHSSSNSSHSNKHKNSSNNNNALIDKSPFKTTYISDEEELELKNTNCTLYSQFHHARQAIYQQFTQKVDAIRHSALLSTEKRKLNIKISAIDAKVQEKKLFLSYLDMSRPQPNSWLISNSALAMNGFARKIANAQQIPSVYSATTPLQNDNMVVVNESNEAEAATNQEVTSASSTADNQQPQLTVNTNVNMTMFPRSAASKRIKKPKFSDFNVRVLRDWYETHTNNPYPSSNEKHLMCQLTGLTKYQVSRWFCNVRTRKPPPELSDNDEDIAGKTDHTPPPPPPPPNAMFSHPHPHAHPHSHPHSHHALNATENAGATPALFNNIAPAARAPPPPPPPPMPHTLSSVSPYNLPPMTSMPPNHGFNFSRPPMGMSHLHRQLPQHRHQQQTKENFIDSSDHIEGLMPTIESKFNHQPSMNPPPLIDDTSNHAFEKK